MMELYNYKVELNDCCEKTLSHFTTDEYEIAICTCRSNKEWHKEGNSIIANYILIYQNTKNGIKMEIAMLPTNYAY